MASARVITSDIWADEWFGNLSFMQQALWIGLFSKCADMQGRMRDIPTLIRSQVWPYQDVPVDDIERALTLFNDAHKIYRYEVNGKLYIQLLRWWAYQCTRFAGESLFPPPPGWIDHINTNHGETNIKSNWTNFKDHAEQELAYLIPSTEIITGVSTEVGTDPHIHIHIPNHNHNQDHPEGVPSGAQPALAPPEKPIIQPRKSTRQRIYVNEAVKAYSDITRVNPNGPQADEITEKVAPSALDKWKSVLKAWMIAGHLPTNVTGMLDWYRDGIPKNGNGKPHARAGPPEYPHMDIQEVGRLNDLAGELPE